VNTEAVWPRLNARSVFAGGMLKALGIARRKARFDTLDQAATNKPTTTLR
jgi:hypothetical protein